MIQLPDNVSKLLIVKPSSLGDIIHSLPFLNAISNKFPKAKIDWVISDTFASVLDGHPNINRLWSLNLSDWKKPSKAFTTAAEILKLRKNLKAQNYDITIDLQGLLRSGLITSFTKSPVRVGFLEARECSTSFYTDKVEGGLNVHAVDRYLMIAEALGAPAEEASFNMLYEDYPLPFSDYAVIVPGARWVSKIWPSENFGTLASLLPIKTVIVGSSADTALADIVEKHAMGNAVNLVGKTSLKELAGIIRNSRLMITNDSGPMHIASAFNVPVYALFGPTSPGLTGPYGKGHTILKTEIECAPCFKRKCTDLRCLDAITLSDVLDAIKKNTSLSF